MATFHERTNKDGTTSIEVAIRRQGHAPLYKRFKSKPVAEAWARREESRIEREDALPEVYAAKDVLSAVIDRYIETVLPMKSQSHRRVQGLQLQYWKEVMGFVRLFKISTTLIARERDILLKDGKQRATVNRYMAALSAVLSKASGEWGLMNSNPCRRIKRLPEPPGRDTFLTAAQITKLISECKKSKEPALEHMVQLSLATGIRQKEMLLIRACDIDYDKRLLAVRITKNSTPRHIPLTQTAIVALRALQGHSRTDGYIINKWPRECWDRARERACMINLRWHDLRHTTASHLAQQGVPIRTIADILGHKTIQMAMRYSHLSPDHLRDGMDAADNSMFNSKP